MEKKDVKTYNYNIADSTLDNYPVELFEGQLCYSEDVDDVFELPTALPISGHWGIVERIADPEKKLPLPRIIDVTWLSVAECKFYEFYDELDLTYVEQMWELHDKNNNPVFDTFLVGLAPLGRIAVWMSGILRSDLVLWDKGTERGVPIEEICSLNEDEEPLTIEDYCDNYVHSDEDLEKFLNEVGLPDECELDDLMKQYVYRYSFEFKHYDKKENKWTEYDNDAELPNFQELFDLRVDGSFNKMGDDSLMNYHVAGKPLSICAMWTLASADYACYIHLAPEQLQSYIDLACDEDEKQPFDINVSVDWEQYKVRVSLKKQDGSSFILPEELMQTIVFQAGSECFKTEPFTLTDEAFMW